MSLGTLQDTIQNQRKTGMAADLNCPHPVQINVTETGFVNHTLTFVYSIEITDPSYSLHETATYIDFAKNNQWVEVSGDGTVLDPSRQTTTFSGVSILYNIEDKNLECRFTVTAAILQQGAAHDVFCSIQPVYNLSDAAD